MGPIVAMTDPDGRALVSVKGLEPLRFRPVWAVYQFRKGYAIAVARSSGFLPLASAKEMADQLNGKRIAEDNFYYRVCRLAIAAAA